jgi:hypothetical protein
MNTVLDFPTPTRRVPSPTIAAAHQALMVELIQALEQGEPKRLCSTPGFADDRWPAAEIVNDDFAAKGDTSLDALLRLLGLCSRSSDPAVRTAAQAWIAAAARRHADFHCADAARGGGDVE